MALDLIGVIVTVGTLFGLLALVVVGIKHQGAPYRKSLLLLFLLSVTYYSFLIFLVRSGLMLAYPHFFRTGSPFLYMIPISLMLLGRAAIRNQSAPRRADLLWFAIPLVHLVELMPFYLQDAGFKAAFLEGLPSDRDVVFYGFDSWIPTIWHYRLQGILGTGLYAYTFWISLGPLRLEQSRGNRPMLKWINLIALFLGFAVLACLFLLLGNDNSRKIQEFTALLFGICLIAVFLSFFLTPEILLAREEAPGREGSGVNPGKKDGITPGEEEAFRALVDQFFQRETAFLEPEFRLQDMAAQLSLSRNTLSYLINSIYGKNFNQLLNEKRIEVALQRLGTTEWKQLTLEGIAREVGFKSRTTFIKAFREKTGCTPSEYKSR